jgi:hypothetical protein
MLVTSWLGNTDIRTIVNKIGGGQSTVREKWGIVREISPLRAGFISHPRRQQRACVFLKWSKMVLIPFCTFLSVLKKTVTQRNQEQARSPKPSLNHGRRIKTILGQFRNKHARYFFLECTSERLISPFCECLWSK